MPLSSAYNSSEIFSVSQLNREAKRLLGEYFLSVRVEGEISNLSTPASGHIYFSLKDDAAQIRCVMFRLQQKRLPFKPENGKQVMVTAEVSLYEPRGDYQLIVARMEPAGHGLLQQAFEVLKDKLLAEGLFEQQRKQQIPRIPARIGIVTSPTGAAIHDILTVLKRRFPAIPVIIYPVEVQGEKSKNNIVKALSLATNQNIVDVLIIARGGGSLEDLWAFNEEIVARAIADCKIPIISGIGHEVNVTIADFVADLRAPTPSAAAEHAVPVQQEWLANFQLIDEQLQRQIHQTLRHFRQNLTWMTRTLQQQHPGQKLHHNAQRLDELEHHLINNWQHQLTRHQNRLERNSHALNQHDPLEQIAIHQQKLSFLQKRIQHDMWIKLKQWQQQLASVSQTLQMVSPLATLDRGYAIVKKQSNQEIIKSSQQLKVGDVTETRLAQGHIISQIKEINHD